MELSGPRQVSWRPEVQPGAGVGPNLGLLRRRLRPPTALSVGLTPNPRSIARATFEQVELSRIPCQSKRLLGAEPAPCVAAPLEARADGGGVGRPLRRDHVRARRRRRGRGGAGGGLSARSRLCKLRVGFRV